MADIENSAWSETAASNNSTPPDGWPEGQNPSTVNNCAREMMAALKADWDRSGPTVTSGGSANAQTLTYTRAVVALVRGQKYAFIAGFTNTGACTLAISGLTATAIRINNAALKGGEIVAGSTYGVVYDGTAYQLLDGAPTPGITQIGATLTPVAATATFTAIPPIYSALALYWTGLSSDTATRALQIQLNADTTAGNYPGKNISGTTVTAKSTASLLESPNGAAANTNSGTLIIRPYQGGPFTLYEGYYLDPAGAITWTQGAWVSTSAVTQVQLLWNGTGNFDAGTTSLWGIA